MLKKILANICFWAGHISSKILETIDTEWWANIWYPIYNKLMIISYNLHPEAWITAELGQGDSGSEG